MKWGSKHEHDGHNLYPSMNSVFLSRLYNTVYPVISYLPNRIGSLFATINYVYHTAKNSLVFKITRHTCYDLESRDRD